MPFYRAKPVVITAVQFDPLGEHKMELPAGVLGIHSPNADNWGYAGCRFFVTTMHGDQIEVYRGDYLVDEPNGVNLYPVKREVFEAKYSPLVRE